MSDSVDKPGLFCISTYVKGQAFLREANRQGCAVTLLTVDKLREAEWPHEALAELLTMPEGLTPEQVLNTVTYLARTRRIDRIVALDEFDLEIAALLREQMRLPGMGVSATALFRDKLAMRVRAKAAGVPVPEFSGVFHHDDLYEFMTKVPGPWLLKPRANASAIGIKMIHEPNELWPILDQLGDLQSHYVLERFVTGAVYHVEGITWKGEVVFSAPHKYGAPPMTTMHQGGVFTTRSLDPASEEAQELVRAHKSVIAALGMVCGVTHTEFIRSAEDGRFYFLESAARVGGAYIAEVVEAATGVNPWVEWARIEAAVIQNVTYALPVAKGNFAGSVISLARQESPDTNGYNDAEVVHRLVKHHHAGLIVRSDSATRVQELVDAYGIRFLNEFCASAPVPDKPSA